MRSVQARAARTHVDDLRQLIEHPGPFVSVVLTVEDPSEDGPQRTELRWRALRDSLAQAGAPDGLLGEIEAVVAETPPAGGSLAVVTADGAPTVAARHLEPPAGDRSSFGPLPVVAPIIEWRQLAPAHVVAKVDRTGADLTVVGHWASAEFHIDGDHDVIANPKAGGWSELRFQRRAEDSWERNTEQVAAQLERFVELVDARLVIVAGDPTAVGILTREVPDGVREILHTVDGSRHDQGSHFDRDVIHLVATGAAEDTVALLRELRQELGRDGAAAEGPAATLEALAAAQVGVLALHDDPADERTAWFGERPEQVGADAETVRDLGASDPAEGRLIDVAIRAALGTGAAIRIIPAHGGPAGGIGALLRWT